MDRGNNRNGAGSTSASASHSIMENKDGAAASKNALIFEDEYWNFEEIISKVDIESSLVDVKNTSSQSINVNDDDRGEESDKINIKCSRGDLDEITNIQPTNALTPFNIGDPHASQTKSRKKGVCKETTSGRFKSRIEVSMA
ncbi:hypothetical protein GH714_018508 [Hevea brasiliensis]|uniref:Uncharacterized protein n=1 Tax=Hevea brasiliensis TaxID=3981 RepID=A0A6A6M2G5_HEVBR|nr:hypothetical protein GH714_018508 [Hevea brasiliensis]